MQNFEETAGDTIEHSSTALSELAAREDEVGADGLDSGLNAAERITKYLGKCGGGNIVVVKDVASLQVSAMNNLLKISTNHGNEIKNMSGVTKEVSKQQAIQRSRKALSSMSQIKTTLRGGLDISPDPIKIKKDTMEVVIESKRLRKKDSVKMNSDKENAGFSIQAKNLNYLGNGSIETEFEVYDKSPFSWASDQVQGNVPVMKVNFVEPYEENNPTSKRRNSWHFSKPADIFLKNNNTSSESTDYSLLLFVNTYTNEVYLSSCIYLSVKASDKDVTVLEITSGDLITEAKARYTNVISAFELLTDYDMVDIPLVAHEGELETKVEGRNLSRQENFIFLPKLTKKQLNKDVPYYNLKISVQKGQTFKGANINNLTSTLEKVVESNNLTLDIARLALYNVSIRMVAHKLSCVHFDENEMKYKFDSCELSLFTGKEELHCRCVVAAAFSASYVVMPRLVNPLDIQLFWNVIENPLIVSIVIALWLIFLALFIWGRRKDKQDEIRRGATVLEDNNDNDYYVYLICVVTGNSSLAGTTSDVFMYLKGSWGTSSVHAMKDNTRSLFQSGAENWFVLTTESDLGYLNSAVIWTDYSGSSPSWYLYNIYIQNVQTGESWNLLFNSWLSTVKGGGKIIAELPAVEENNFTLGWFSKVSGKGRVDLRNEHLWVGMIFKTAYNKFTRFRRLATALSMLQALMIVNLSFFEVENEDDSRQFQSVLGFRVHITSVIIGIQSCLLISIFGIGLSSTFNRIRARPNTAHQQEKEVEDALNKRKKVKTLAALQTYLSNDVSDDKALYLFKKFNDQPETESEENKSSLTAKSDLWFTLPWWFIYIYWTFIAVFNVFIAYYIMLFGLAIGYEKSINWLVSFFSGFAFNILVVQPLKVVGMVLFFVLVLKQTYSLKQMAPFTSFGDAATAVKIHKSKARTYSASMISTHHRRPPNTDQISDILARLQIEASSREMLRDLLLFSVFLTALIAMIYQHSDINRSFYQTGAVNKMLFKSVIEDGEETSVLDEISTVDDMWTFLATDLTNFLIEESDEKLDVTRLFFTGTARIRQVRVERDQANCENLQNNLMAIYQKERCSFSMFDGTEETKDFNGSWLYPMRYVKTEETEMHVKPRQGIVNEEEERKKKEEEEKKKVEEKLKKQEKQQDDDDEEEIYWSMYKYRTAAELKTTPIAAPRATYPGGGFILTLQRDSIILAVTDIRKLNVSGWVDHLTRCVFVEFTLYNPDSSLFTNVVIGFEFDVDGGPYPFKIITTARLYHYGPNKFWTQVAEVAVAICSAFYTAVVMNNIMKLGIAVFVSSIWSWVDVTILSLIYLLAVLTYQRDASMVSVMSVFAQYGNNRYLDFQNVFYKDYALALLEGFLGGVAFLKLINVLRFNPFSKIFMMSVNTAKGDVLGFTILTGLYITGFSLAGRVIFGRFLGTYLDMAHCLFSLLLFTMGEADYPLLVAANKLLGPIYFLIVMFVTQYVILNFFVAMVRDGLDIARSMEFGKKDATMKYILDTIKMYLGIGSNRQVDKKSATN